MDGLAELRRGKGFSQRTLAKAAGVSPSTIFEIERGRHSTPHPSTAKKLAEAMGVEVTEVLEAVGSPKASAPQSTPEEELLGRSSAFINALRAYFWDLRLRWMRSRKRGSKPTPNEIRNALDLLGHLTEHDVFEGPWTPEEQLSLQLLFMAADKLRPIAEEMATETEAEDLQREVDKVFGEEFQELGKRLAQASA